MRIQSIEQKLLNLQHKLKVEKKREKEKQMKRAYRLLHHAKLLQFEDDLLTKEFSQLCHSLLSASHNDQTETPK